MQTKKVLDFNRVGFGFPGQALILSEVNFSIHQGEKILILGANGSGKSTLAKLAAGILKPTIGEIEYTGTNNQRETKKLPVGMVFQDSRSQIVGATVEEDIAFGLTVLQCHTDEIQEKVSFYLTQFGLIDKRTLPIERLSGGELRRLALAGALITEPELLILDEPLAMLDSCTRDFLVDFIKNRKKTILWLDHDLKSIRYTDKWFILNHLGNLTEVTLQDINSPQKLTGYRIASTPLQFLEWSFPTRIRHSIDGPEGIEFR